MKRILLFTLASFIVFGLFGQSDEMTPNEQGPVENGPIIINIGGFKDDRGEKFESHRVDAVQMDHRSVKTDLSAGRLEGDITEEKSSNIDKTAKNQQEVTDPRDEVVEEVRTDLRIYPVPAETDLKIDLGQEVEAEINLMDIIGQTVYTVKEDVQHVTIPVSDFNSGTYFIMIKVNDQMINKRVQIR